MSNDTSTTTSGDNNALRLINSSADVNEPLVLVDCGDVHFFVPAKDILTLSAAQKIISSGVEHACGELKVEESAVPVFVINKSLQVNPVCPPHHATVIVLEYQGILFGLSCAAITKIETNDLQFKALQFFTVPINMSSRKQPFSKFAVVGKRAVGLTSALHLLGLLNTRGVVLSMSTETKSIRRQANV